MTEDEKRRLLKIVREVAKMPALPPLTEHERAVYREMLDADYAFRRSGAQNQQQSNDLLNQTLKGKLQ